MITITLWTEKRWVEKYEREVSPKVEEILKPYLTSPVTFKHYELEPGSRSTSWKPWRPETGARRAPPEQAFALLRLPTCKAGTLKTYDSDPGTSSTIKPSPQPYFLRERLATVRQSSESASVSIRARASNFLSAIRSLACGCARKFCTQLEEGNSAMT